jgi:hypothetical protein
VPFGAFTARQSLYDHWNTSAKSTFHSTTFQPNTIASLHFMRCLEEDDPEFHATLADDLRQIKIDVNLRKTLFGRLYSRSLAKAIAATGFDRADVRAAGDFLLLDGLKIFDGVSGVACSVRGHNPPSYATQMDALAGVDCEAEVADRLRDLTGLDCMLPAVSGASAVEVALKVGLVAQFPRRHVLALKAGFGGKTLFALTGTWSTCYKEHIDPLASFKSLHVHEGKAAPHPHAEVKRHPRNLRMPLVPRVRDLPTRADIPQALAQRQILPSVRLVGEPPQESLQSSRATLEHPGLAGHDRQV